MTGQRKETCSTKGCTNPHRPGQRTCRPCHAKEQRAWRRAVRQNQIMAQQVLARLLGRKRPADQVAA